MQGQHSHLSRGDNLFLEIKKENLKQMGDEVMPLNHPTPLISGFPSLLSTVFCSFGTTTMSLGLYGCLSQKQTTSHSLDLFRPLL